MKKKKKQHYDKLLLINFHLNMVRLKIKSDRSLSQNNIERRNKQESAA